MNLRAGHWYGLLMLVMLALCFAITEPVLADTNIGATISDPDHPSAGENEGNTIAEVSGSPSVSVGDNQVPGKISIKGKPGIKLPVKVGDRVKISLSPGVCYMRTPNCTTYRNYVSWPQQAGNEKNQIYDAPGVPGMIFETATPHSMVLRVGNIDSTANTMLLVFNFDQEDYSCVRVAPFIGIVDQFAGDSVNKLTRLDFFKLFVTIAPIRYISPSPGMATKSMEDKFSDLDGMTPWDKEIIRPLIDSGLVDGYAGGYLKPNAYITRNEAFAVAGRGFGHMAMTGFRDGVAKWGDASINYAARRFLYWGYPDGTFRGDNPLSRAQALELLQSCFETRALEDSNQIQGQALGFI